MTLADTLNRDCACSTLQPDLLQDRFAVTPALAPWADDLAATHPHLFSPSPVFMSAHDHAQVEAAVATLHRVALLPAFSESAVARAPAAARERQPGADGVFMGYDFHLASDGPRLIEINTNAGGALLHAAALHAHRACCRPLDHMFSAPADLERFDDTVMDMFLAEWRAERGDAPLRTVAIVDDDPATQYLAPEFALARGLLAGFGIDAVVADPRELEWRDGHLRHRELQRPIDLVYNRLTDFYLDAPAHASLRSAWTSGAAVITPHPRAHAVHADKRNLMTLSDPALLQAAGATHDDIDRLLRVVPKTEAVTHERAEDLWARRRNLFFKPNAGFGSRAAYRGDKLTRRVWEEILAGGFIAQELVPPSERRVLVDGECRSLKVDVRAYSYRGRILLLAARTWAGQTTNFRTAGGGFSPMVVIPDVPAPVPAPIDNAQACAC